MLRTLGVFNVPHNILFDANIFWVFCTNTILVQLYKYYVVNHFISI